MLGGISMTPKRNRKILFLIILSLLAVLGIAGLVYYPLLQQKWVAPLGPGLGLPTYTLPSSSITPSQAVSLTSNTQEFTHTILTTSTFSYSLPTTPAGTPTPRPFCGGPPLTFILGIGADSGESYNYGLADVIRVARVDFVTPKVSVLAMPRDLWVEIPDIEQHYNITHGKLNQAYFYGGPGMGYYDGSGGAPGLLARTLDLNFSLRVEHYGAVNMNTFVKIVDAVGGIDLYLPEDVDGRSEDPMTIDLGFFPKGQHHFSGEQALRFARVRKKYNDFTRMDHQTMVLCALRSKLKEPSVIVKIPRIVSAFKDSVQTDLSPEQISQLACLLPKVKRENLLFTSLPDEILNPGRVYNPRQKDTTFVMEADYDVIRDYVAQFMAGTWPTEPEEPTCP